MNIKNTHVKMKRIGEEEEQQGEAKENNDARIGCTDAKFLALDFPLGIYTVVAFINGPFQSGNRHFQTLCIYSLFSAMNGRNIKH